MGLAPKHRFLGSCSIDEALPPLLASRRSQPQGRKENPAWCVVNNAGEGRGPCTRHAAMAFQGQGVSCDSVKGTTFRLQELVWSCVWFAAFVCVQEGGWCFFGDGVAIAYIHAIK